MKRRSTCVNIESTILLYSAAQEEPGLGILTHVTSFVCCAFANLLTVSFVLAILGRKIENILA